MCDQLRHDCLGVYGNSIVNTVNLDNLASDGFAFESAYSSCPACVPARACCLTGQNQWNINSLSYGASMRSDYPITIPKLMKEHGYATIAIGKNHFTPQRAMHGYDKVLLDESARGESTGFVSEYMQFFKQETENENIIGEDMDFNGYNGNSYPYEEYLHPTSWVKDCVIEELDKNKDKNFFLKISFARPHSPYDAPKRLFDYYFDMDLPQPICSDWGNKYAKVQGGLTRWRGQASALDNKKSRSGYYGNVTFIDETVGEITDYLKQNNLYDNTTIVFTSDHGDMLGDHNLWRKTFAYEGSTHIPMIVKPNISNENLTPNISKPVTLYDIAKTLTNRIKPMNYITDGIDLLTESRDILHGEYINGYDNKMDMHYLVDGEYKFIWYMRTREIQLFDLKNDKNEMSNIADNPQYKDVVETFKCHMRKIMSDRGVEIIKKKKLKKFSFKLPYNIYGENT